MELALRVRGPFFARMAGNSFIQPNERREHRFAVLLFIAALAFHFWGATVGWKSLNLPGCEFRQTQTAVSAFFIQREHNFSLAYPTPVLGKPWAIPMEFPLYQWTVVWVSDGLKVPLTQAARAVSIVCFYLALPALAGLLARLGLNPARRLFALGLVVTCPLYVYYARSFLIETMALMFGAWFLLAYVRAVEGRAVSWLLLAAAAGAGCGLVKVTTLLFFLMPAFLWTLWWFWQDWQSGPGARGSALVRRVLWCALAVAVPVAASVWWVHYSDAVKETSIAGNFLISSRLRSYNFGTGMRFSPALWRQHWEVLFTDITTPAVLVGCAALALGFGRRWWWLTGVLVFLFFVVQMIFPILYAWHEYYYVASGFTLLLAYGLALGGVFESRWPRWAAWALLLAVYGLQMRAYVVEFFPNQRLLSGGGSNLTLALRHATAPDEVLVIAGDDWSSMTPYFAQRRSLMIRRNLERTWEEITPAFERLKGEDVTALVLHGEQRNNQDLVDLAVRYFQLDPRPAFRWRDATVYLHEQLRPQAAALVKEVPEIELIDPAPAGSNPLLRREMEMATMLRRYRDDFVDITPTPFKYYSTYGTTPLDYNGRKVYNAHPDTRFWFKVGPGPHTFSAEVGLLPGAYDAKLPYGDRSDGIEVRFEVEKEDGSRSLLFSHPINPRDQEEARGLQRIEHTFELGRPEVVVMTIGPGPSGNSARDWAMLGRVEIR